MRPARQQGFTDGALADVGDDLVSADEFFGGSVGFARKGAVFLEQEFRGPAEDAAGGVEIVDGEPSRAERSLAERRVAARDGHEEADFYGVAGGRGGEGEGQKCKAEGESQKASRHGANANAFGLVSQAGQKPMRHANTQIRGGE